MSLGSDVRRSATDAFGDLLTAVLELQRLTDLTVARDGHLVAVTVEPSYTEPDSGPVARIWAFTSKGKATRLTNGPGADGLPRWSPVDGRLAFASDREHRGRMSIYLLEGDDEPRPLGSIDGFVEDLAWDADGRSIVALTADPGSDAAAVSSAVKLSEETSDPDVVRPAQAWRRLFRVDADRGSTEEIGPPRMSVWEFDLIDSDRAVAIVSLDPSERGWYSAHLALLDLSGRGHRELYQPTWQIQSPSASPSGRWVAFAEGWASDRALVAGDLKAIDVDTGRIVDLSENTPDVTWVRWRDEESIWFAGWHGTGSSHGIVRLDGTLEWREDEPASIGASSFIASIAPSTDGPIWGLREADREPPELVLKRSVNHRWSSMSDFNPLHPKVVDVYPTIEEVHWEGTDTLEVSGLLIRPPRHDGSPLPLIVDVHGGPTWSWKHAFDPGGLPLAGAGYAILMPNYRGSSGRGQSYAQLNIGDPAGKEFDDLLKGISWCVTEGIAEAGRIGIMGRSYGGYLTAWAVATRSEFSAAVMISGISDLISCHHTCNNAMFYELMLRGTPHQIDDLTLYLDRSPVVHAARASTPTLILHGAEDLCTPLGQAQEFYQVLAHNGVPTELVIYPREGHGFRERAHQVDAWQRIRAWFDSYLRGHTS